MPLRHACAATALTAAAALTACGGGGLELITSGGGLSASSAASYAANATLIASDSTGGLDDAVVLTQLLASAVTGTVVVNVQVPCAVSGNAVISISGGTVTSVRNGQLDAGEVYQVVFNNCRGSADGATVNGTLTLTVQTAASGTLATALTASNLVITLPRGGTVTLNGDCARTTTSSASGGTTQLNSRFTSARLTSNTQLNGRSNSFTLSGVDLSRVSNWQGTALQSSSINGAHTLAATLAGQSFSHGVSTDGSVVYAVSGLPASGRWLLNVGSARLVVSVAGGTATVTVDDGNNGSIDSTYSFPVNRLQSDAG